MTIAAWVRERALPPEGGIQLEVTYRTGNGTSVAHLSVIGETLKRLLDCEPFPGSLNLHAATAVCLPEPLELPLGRRIWQFAPVVIADRAVGIVARRPPPACGTFLEVFASRQLRSELNLEPGAAVTIALHAGTAHLAA